MQRKLKAICASTAACALFLGAQPAGATWIEVTFEGGIHGGIHNPGGEDWVELTIVYDPDRADPDADPDTSIGIYQGDFAVGAAFVVNGETRFFCGTVDGYESQGDCLPEPGLSLIFGIYDDYEQAFLGFDYDRCPWGSTLPLCESSILRDSVSGDKLLLNNLYWTMQDLLDSDSIYQLPGPSAGVRTSSFDMIELRDEFGTLIDYWEEGRTFDLTSVRYVPEPGTLALFGIGLGAMGLSRRKKRA